MANSDPEPTPNPEEQADAEARRAEAERIEAERAAAERAAVDAAAVSELHRRTRRSFLVALIAAGAGYGAWRWLVTRQQLDGVVWPVRRALEFNERVSKRLFDPRRRIAEMPASAITADGPRVNGNLGLVTRLDPASWRLHIAGAGAALTLEQLRTLPEVSQITPLHCIEGWTTVARWTGVRFADFVDKFHPEGRKRPYVGLATPDGQYYVGLDIASAMHPQTLLCYAINGQPLIPEHGAPLRLLIPTKYGIKNLKRVGEIRFTDERPRDYWAERGYDWFAGF